MLRAPQAEPGLGTSVGILSRPALVEERDVHFGEARRWGGIASGLRGRVVAKGDWCS